MLEGQPRYDPAEGYRPINKIVKSHYLDHFDFHYLEDSPSIAIHELTDFLAPSYRANPLGDRYPQLPPDQKELVDATVAERLVDNHGLNYLITLLRISDPESWSSEQQEEIQKSDILSEQLDGGLSRQILLQRADSWSDRVKRFAIWKATVLAEGRAQASKAQIIFFTDTPIYKGPGITDIQAQIARSDFVGHQSYNNPEHDQFKLSLIDENITVYKRLQREIFEKQVVSS